jgi:TPP-dependent pyruvate/acetoin dehydrogenase alpha subunit
MTMAKKPQPKMTPIEPRRRRRVVPKDLLVDLYKKMLHVYYMEERIKTYVRAG